MTAGNSKNPGKLRDLEQDEERQGGGDLSTDENTIWRPLRPRCQSHAYPGWLIAVEGIDGAGKSTVIERITSYCQVRDIRVTFVRIPSNGLREYPMWKAWTDESLGVDASRINGFGLSILALGDRLVTQSAEIIPALEDGQLVICDRYVLSSLAYESTDIHEDVLSRMLAPDLGVLLDLDIETVFERLSKRSYEAMQSRDRAEKPILLERFRDLARINGYHSVRSAQRPVEETVTEMLSLMKERGILP